MTPLMTHNNMCRSRMLLPCCCAAAAALWLLPADGNWREWDWLAPRAAGLATCAATAALLMEMCNSNALIRVYTRSVSSLFVMWTACVGGMHDWQTGTAAAFCLTAGQFLTFRIDRSKRTIAYIFHVFLFLGAACLFVPQLVVMLPFYYRFAFLMSPHGLSPRAACAGIIGFLLPGAAATGFCLASGDTAPAAGWLADLTTLYPIGTGWAPEAQHGAGAATVACWATLVILSVWGAGYFARNMRAEKARVRTLYQIICTQTAAITAIACLQPQHAAELLPAMMASCSPIAAHYFTLSGSRLRAIVLALTILVMCGVALETLSKGGIDTAAIMETLSKRLR